jgi:integral membrane protein
MMGAMDPVRLLRPVALVEATTFLALLVASVIKHSGDGATGVAILGPVHGVLFLAYVFLAFAAREPEGWSPRTTVLVLIGAVLPFGGYVVDATILRRRPATA